MEILVQKGYCMALELAEVVSRHVNKESYQETKNKFLMRYGARFDEEGRRKFIDKMDRIEQAYGMVADQVPEDAMTEFLFRKHYCGNTFSILAHIMLINFQDICITDTDSYLDACRERWHRMRENKLRLKAVGYSALALEEGELPLKDSLLRDIDRIECPVAFKWDLLKVFDRFDYYIEETRRIFRQIEEPLREALKMLDPIAEELTDFWTRQLNPEIIGEMAAAMGVPAELTEGKKVILQILRMACDQAIMDEQWGETELPLCLGVCIEWANQFRDDQIDRRLLCEKLRVFSEDSKFEILQLLKNQGSYGQEIARRVKLDAATVSRHLSVMQRHGLIYIERKVGRNIYYRANQNEIRNLMELLQKIFLE